MIKNDLKNELNAIKTALNAIKTTACPECGGEGICFDEGMVLPCSCVEKGLNPLNLSEELDVDPSDWETPKWLIKLIARKMEIESDLADLDGDGAEDIEAEDIEGF